MLLTMYRQCLSTPIPYACGVPPQQLAAMQCLCARECASKRGNSPAQYSDSVSIYHGRADQSGRPFCILNTATGHWAFQICEPWEP